MSSVSLSGSLFPPIFRTRRSEEPLRHDDTFPPAYENIGGLPPVMPLTNPVVQVLHPPALTRREPMFTQVDLTYAINEAIQQHTTVFEGKLLDLHRRLDKMTTYIAEQTTKERMFSGPYHGRFSHPVDGFSPVCATFYLSSCFAPSKARIILQNNPLFYLTHEHAQVCKEVVINGAVERITVHQSFWDANRITRPIQRGDIIDLTSLLPPNQQSFSPRPNVDIPYPYKYIVEATQYLNIQHNITILRLGCYDSAGRRMKAEDMLWGDRILAIPAHQNDTTYPTVLSHLALIQTSNSLGSYPIIRHAAYFELKRQAQEFKNFLIQNHKEWIGFEEIGE